MPIVADKHHSPASAVQHTCIRDGETGWLIAWIILVTDAAENKVFRRMSLVKCATNQVVFPASGGIGADEDPTIHVHRSRRLRELAVSKSAHQEVGSHVHRAAGKVVLAV